MNRAATTLLLALACPPAFAEGQFPDPHTAPIAAAPVKYRRMDLIDFKTDRSTLIGQRVELSGLVMPFVDDVGLLMGQPGDIHPVFVRITRLRRDQRRDLEACPNACRSTVFGTVAIVRGGQIGVEADAVSISSGPS